MNTTREDISKYERELGEINKQLTELEDRKSKLIRVGVRIEGALAYMRSKEQEQLAAEAADKAGKAAAPAAPAEPPAPPAPADSAEPETAPAEQTSAPA